MDKKYFIATLFILMLILNYTIKKTIKIETINKPKRLNEAWPNPEWVKTDLYDEYFKNDNISSKIPIDEDLDEQFKEYLNNDNKLNEILSKEYLRAYNKSPPNNYNKWLNFAKKYKCPLHPNYYLQIHKDLKPFRSIKITKELIEESLIKFNYLRSFFIQIKDVDTFKIKLFELTVPYD